MHHRPARRPRRHDLGQSEQFVPQYDAKMVRPLAVANDKRLALLPDVPTFIDAVINSPRLLRGIAAPPGIPAETVAFYENMMKRMSDSSDGRKGI
jgi:tripartite-type tricarboxylate transporter receptor subunit TctC